jgi:hypothetical protein
VVKRNRAGLGDPGRHNQSPALSDQGIQARPHPPGHFFGRNHPMTPSDHAPEQPKSRNEDFYDREMAPVLAKLADICRARGMAMIAAVEFDPGAIAVSGSLPDNPSMAMTMLTHCANAGEDFDAYALSLLGWMDEQGIDFSLSACLAAIYEKQAQGLLPAAPTDEMSPRYRVEIDQNSYVSGYELIAAPAPTSQPSAAIVTEGSAPVDLSASGRLEVDTSGYVTGFTYAP